MMGQDWEELAGEEGQEVTSSRLKRMFKLGSMGARVTASSVASKVGRLFARDADRRQAGLERAQAENAQRIVEVLGELKGASMKVGQMLSADPELLPDAFSDVLSSLQNDAPPMTYATVRDQIEDGLGRSLESVFSFFDPDSIGAASIGQVHRARLEDGQEVAVKVQYPGVADSLASDLDTLESMLAYARIVVDRDRLEQIFAEVRRMLLEEADYNKEADTLGHFHQILKTRDGICAPKPYPEWSSEQVLVMEYADGRKLDEALVDMGDGPARQKLLRRWMRTYSWMFHELLELHADPHPGNFLLRDDNTLVMLDFGCVKTYEASFADDFLEVLDAVWQNDPERIVDLYQRLGFGGDGVDWDAIAPELLLEYHEIILEPFLRDEPFSFGDWAPAKASKAFMLRNPSFLKLTPPANALAYFRVLSGAKGLLGKLDARLNIFEMAHRTARRRGVLTDG